MATNLWRYKIVSINKITGIVRVQIVRLYNDETLPETKSFFLTLIAGIYDTATYHQEVEFSPDQLVIAESYCEDRLDIVDKFIKNVYQVSTFGRNEPTTNDAEIQSLGGEFDIEFTKSDYINVDALEKVDQDSSTAYNSCSGYNPIIK